MGHSLDDRASSQELFDEAKMDGWTVISMTNDGKRIFAFESTQLECPLWVIADIGARTDLVRFVPARDIWV
jgi:hypothetical protein